MIPYDSITLMQFRIEVWEISAYDCSWYVYRNYDDALEKSLNAMQIDPEIHFVELHFIHNGLITQRIQFTKEELQEEIANRV